MNVMTVSPGLRTEMQDAIDTYDKKIMRAMIKWPSTAYNEMSDDVYCAHAKKLKLMLETRILLKEAYDISFSSERID